MNSCSAPTFQTLFTRSSARRAVPPSTRRGPHLPAAHLAASNAPLARTSGMEALRGPGWFDSSWDLSRGLEVREGLPGDAKLNEWIEACLRS